MRMQYCGGIHRDTNRLAVNGKMSYNGIQL